MDHLSRRIDALSARLRLQTLITFGALTILVFAAGGADVVAKSLVADGWTLKTKNLAGTLLNRLVAETDTDIAQIKVQNASLVLEKRNDPPWTANGTNEGAIYYDDDENKVKVSNGTSWNELGGGGLIYLQKYTVENSRSWPRGKLEYGVSFGQFPERSFSDSQRLGWRTPNANVVCSQLVHIPIHHQVQTLYSSVACNPAASFLACWNPSWIVGAFGFDRSR